jgi:hypothetical protein
MAAGNRDTIGRRQIEGIGNHAVDKAVVDPRECTFKRFIPGRTQQLAGVQRRIVNRFDQTGIQQNKAHLSLR